MGDAPEGVCGLLRLEDFTGDFRWGVAGTVPFRLRTDCGVAGT